LRRSKRGIASARLAFPLLEQSEVASFRTELVHRLRRFFSQYADQISRGRRNAEFH
jgi:hypothetical protein